MPRVFIIAYGNPLRSDDGVAWLAGESLKGRFPTSEVEILCLQQLMPELAESIRRAKCVIFVDAAVPVGSGRGHAGAVRVKEIQAEAASPSRSASHGLSPMGILDLALRLYGVTPRAFCVTLTGENFGHGESLSPVVATALPALISHIESLAREALSQDSPLNSAKP